MKGFLYGQTEYNMLNNAIHLDDYFAYARQNSFTFLSITDANLYGCYKFYQQCLAHNIKPIIGLEITYIDDDSYQSKLLAYAKTNLGFQNLLKITTYLKTNSIPYGLSFLKEYSKDIAFISVYNESIIERLHTSHAYKELANKLEELKKQFEFYIGYSYTNRLDKLTANQDIIKLVQEYNTKCLPIHNCRYLNDEDKIIYETLTKINGKGIEIKDYEDYHFDLNPMMTEELNTFVNSVNLDLFKQETYLPKYPNLKGLTAKDYLRILCQKGLIRRLNGKKNPNYEIRLDYELSVIDKMGYNDYFLIVWDFILYAKKRNILVGPGRGSAAGSLVAYCLGITDIDPLKYNLLFERFLNPERISMPDIDTDFPDNYRDEVIAYVNKLYGKKHVCSISAYNTFQIKSSIRDVGRIQKIESTRLDEIISLVEKTGNFDQLLEEFSSRKDIYDFLYIVKGLEGLPRHISTHAAGIIICSEELDNIIPLQEGINDLYQSQFEASDLEHIGLLKMDFLGIRNLTIISDVMQNIPNFTIKELRDIPLNDPKTFRLLQQADTLGVFQLESTGIRKVLANLKPERFEDLVAVLALYRPGPMDNIDEFIARRHGKPFSYLHPILKPILASTYGIIVYQEQIMLIAQEFAGMSLGEADLLRRAVSKKKESELLKLENDFLKGALKKGYSEQIAREIYQYILKFANYGFNKSHSVAYSLLAYQMAYLKAHYFNIFISKILNNVIGSTKTMLDYLSYAKEHQVQAYGPNVNISSTIFEINKVGLFMPLQVIHSVGEVIAKTIVKERNENGLFKDFNDFKRRTRVPENVLEALIFSGALDCFGLSKKKMIDSKDSYDELLLRHLSDEIEDNSEYDFAYLKQKELEYLGFNIKYNPFANLLKLQKNYNANYINMFGKRAIVQFEKVKAIKTKQSLNMLVGSIKDGMKTYDFVIFPNVYSQMKKAINLDKLSCIEYNLKLDEKTNQYQVIIKNVIEC